MSTIKNKKHHLTTHGLSSHKLYDVHRQMLYRCQNPKSKDYFMYGARGINVCNEWMDVEKFYTWAIESGYRDGLSIERIDSNKGYNSDNCTWIPINMQGKNTRRIRIIDYNGEKFSCSDFCKKHNLKFTTFMVRINLGWSIDDCLKIKPIKGRNQSWRK